MKSYSNKRFDLLTVSPPSVTDILAISAACVAAFWQGYYYYFTDS